MKTSRRRLFGLLAAAPLVAHLPAVPVPAVAATPTPDIGWAIASTDLELSVSEWTSTFIRPQMLVLARQIDTDVWSALYPNGAPNG
ncbi:hypothetical protein [Reyranella sp.]|uniref:hypothetical protein n=1 Tax=Reyranella sp. TaxID=1929291 RepID=UPI0012131415|nr:hypothetical protein [Reyranella sp.]TAJ89724.1 MAG: hypothetical protein EPO50_04995 [Reyranella sp.]